MPIARFDSPVEALVWAKKHPGDHHAIAVIQHDEVGGAGYFTLRGFSRYEWVCGTGGDTVRWLQENGIVAWEIFDRPEAEKPSFEDITSLLNPHWQKCRCGGFHPVSSSC